ncbi:hypothetical protein D915_003295 [Fasciola hepatica]|uniref:Uncharacterized protein n=1 Tax=Fasciola hepatica TaxID=6192 RepID=A0A4E0S2D0_FASHE|nr:hypothetical protein D915_003295 [Fasciola hepatica]
MNNWTFFIFIWITCSFYWGSTKFVYPEYNQTMYSAKRRMHAEQVLRIAHSAHDYGAKLIAEICPHILTVLQKARKQVEFVDIDAPQMNETVGQAFVTIFENIPYFLEWALLFPDTVRELLTTQPDRIDLIRWAIRLTRLSGLLSSDDERMFTDAEQELRFVPRRPDYHNPYSIIQNMMRENKDALHRHTKPKRKKRVRRPRLTPRMDEL